MRHSSSRLRHCLALLSIAVTVLSASSVWAATEKVLHSFDPNSGEGYFPQAGLIFDSAGNLYGTAAEGGSRACGANGCGTVFDLIPNSNGSWTENTLHNFQGSDGSFPVAPVRFDNHGNLYGTTLAGGSSNIGTLFRLSPVGNGTWVLFELHQFAGGPDGSEPGAVTLDSAGHIYDTALYGGASGDGVAFMFGTQPPTGEIILRAFTSGNDALNPTSPLTLDASGNLYGGAQGGAGGFGVVYKLTPARQSSSWTETLLHTFNGRDGQAPTDGLIFDGAGNLYGETFAGGQYGYGTVFELSPNSDGSWTETVLYSFTGGADGQNPVGGVIFDRAGNLYGMTDLGGPSRFGTVFKLTPSAGQWTETVLYGFTGAADGGAPFGGLVMDSSGNLYGTTSMGGLRAFGQAGVVFEITP